MRYKLFETTKPNYQRKKTYTKHKTFFKLVEDFKNKKVDCCCIVCGLTNNNKSVFSTRFNTFSKKYKQGCVCSRVGANLYICTANYHFDNLNRIKNRRRLSK
jgi:hypothetical protein